MRRVVLTLCCLILVLTGCIHQASNRPNLSDDDVWVCENPRAEFYWSLDDSLTSVIYDADGKKTDVITEQTAGSSFFIYDAEAKICEREDIEEDGSVHKYIDGEAMSQFLLLKCRANYKKDAFDLTVEEDVVNMFGGEKPTLHFEKRNRAEYLKEIGEEP